MARLRRTMGNVWASPSTSRPTRKGTVDTIRTVLRPSRSDTQPPTRLPNMPDIAQQEAESYTEIHSKEAYFANFSLMVCNIAPNHLALSILRIYRLEHVDHDHN